MQTVEPEKFESSGGLKRQIVEPEFHGGPNPVVRTQNSSSS